MAVRRRGVVKGGLGAVIAAGVGMPLYLPAARAQAFPSKPMTFIVPWPAGGSSDITLRAMCEVAEAEAGAVSAADRRAPGIGREDALEARIEIAVAHASRKAFMRFSASARSASLAA